MDTTYYTNQETPTKAQFESNIWYTIGAKGYPVAVDSLETVGGYHYNNHPNRQLGHWIVAYGYTKNVVKTRFADPAHSSAVSWGDLPNEYFSYDTTNFAGRFQTGNGMVW
jgi:hypothetical protein